MSEPTENGNVVVPTEGNGDGTGGQKSAKQLEREAKKAAKIAKLNEKKEKKAAAPPPAKEKAEVIVLICFIIQSNLAQSLHDSLHCRNE